MNGLESTGAEGGPPVILNVDDQDIPRYAKSRVLRHAGYRVVEARDGREALTLVRAQHPSIVLLDVQLPDLSGTDVCQRIKADPATAETLVLQTSATYTSSADRVRGLVGGADGYLSQPAEPEELLAHIEALLRVRDAERKWRVAALALADREQQLELMLAASGAAVWTIDYARGGVETFNARSCELAGLDPARGEWPAGTFCRLLHPEDADIMRRAQAQTAALAGPGERVEYRIVRADGTVRHLIGAGTLQRDPEGRPLRFIGVSTDVTEREQAALALREADRRKDEFLATLSHELRNPLSPIRTAAQLLGAPTLAPAQQAWAQGVIRRQVEHMSRLLDDLLDVSRITQGKLELRMLRTRLRPLLDAAIEAARPLLDARRHALMLELPEHEVDLLVDPARIAQVVSNLLTNAAKYTDTGGRITVHAEVEGDALRLAVSDTGIGWERGADAGLFQMFSQLHGTQSRSEGGLGIGLALVRGLVALHGGTVSAHSEGHGRGSRFTVTLPRALVGAPDEPVAPAVAAPRARLRILVADDNRDAAETLRMLLEFSGHEARAAYDGAAALALAHELRPDVALLDIGMPELDGYALARRLRADPLHAQLTLVALTGWGQDDDRRRALEAGFDRHLTKPVDLEELERLLEERAPRPG